MTRRRAYGLQGWLVAALLAVGLGASAAVVITTLPTLESSLRTDRAAREGERLGSALRRFGEAPGLSRPVAESDLSRLAADVRALTGAEVAVQYRGSSLSLPMTEFDPEGSDLLTSQQAPSPGRLAVRDDGRTVVATATLVVDGVPSGYLVGALPLSGVTPEVAIIRRRVIIAMIAVLGLATLAGIAMARVLGGRIRRLADTAATLAGGDLSARAPIGRIAPEEIVTLGDSLDGMAERLQSLVAQITSERDRDRAMIGSLAEGVLAVAPDGTVAVANDAANRMLGLPEGAESARLDALPASVMDAVVAARAPGAAPEPRVVVLADGTELDVHVARMADDPGAGTVVTLRDVTAQRRLERARRDLVANVSHELKTPIAALKGFLELLEDEGVDEHHRREFLGAMTLETGRLERLVEEQLQLARLDAGALPLEREDIDLADLGELVVAPRVPLARRQGVTLTTRSSADGPVGVEVDPARIEQIVLILLDNALRHTPAGGRVEVIVGRDGDEGTLAVRDTGEGIAAEDQPFVFDRFYRGDASREGRSAGLGLPIARGLAAAHGGAITLDSRVGEGSTFTLRLPLAAPGEITAETPLPGLSEATAPGGPA